MNYGYQEIRKTAKAVFPFFKRGEKDEQKKERMEG